MLSSLVGSIPAIARRPLVAIAALVILGAGVAYTLRSPTNNNTIIEKWEKSQKGGQETGSGISVAILTSSGTFIGSGAAKFGDNKTGSGFVQIGGSVGSYLCFTKPDGTLAYLYINNSNVAVVTASNTGSCPL